MTLASYQERLKTFGAGRGRPAATRWPYTRRDKAAPRPEQLAQVGFYFTPTASNPDCCTCYICSTSTSNWKQHTQLWDCHKDTCALRMLHNHLDQISQTATKNKKADGIDHAPNSSIIIQARLASFGKDWWPHASDNHWHPQPQALAAAGWIYKPYDDAEDATECLYCGISLDGWELNDDPVHEHRKRRPECVMFNLPPPKKATSTKALVGPLEENDDAATAETRKKTEIEVTISDDEPATKLVKPRRGRPPAAAAVATSDDSKKPVKRAVRGRKRKVTPENQDAEGDLSVPVRSSKSKGKHVEFIGNIMAESVADGDASPSSEKLDNNEQRPENFQQLVISDQAGPRTQGKDDSDNEETLQPLKSSGSNVKGRQSAATVTKSGVPTSAGWGNEKSTVDINGKKPGILKPIPSQSSAPADSLEKDPKQQSKRRKLAATDKPTYRGDGNANKRSSSSQSVMWPEIPTDIQTTAISIFDPVKDSLSLKELLPLKKSVVIKEPPTAERKKHLGSANDDVIPDEPINAKGGNGSSGRSFKTPSASIMKRKIGTKERPKFRAGAHSTNNTAVSVKTPVVVVKEGGKSVIKLLPPPSESINKRHGNENCQDNALAAPRHNLHDLKGPPTRSKQSLCAEDDDNPLKMNENGSPDRDIIALETNAMEVDGTERDVTVRQVVIDLAMTDYNDAETDDEEFVPEVLKKQASNRSSMANRKVNTPEVLKDLSMPEPVGNESRFASREDSKPHLLLARVSETQLTIVADKNAMPAGTYDVLSEVVRDEEPAGPASENDEPEPPPTAGEANSEALVTTDNEAAAPATLDEMVAIPLPPRTAEDDGLASAAKASEEPTAPVILRDDSTDQTAEDGSASRVIVVEEPIAPIIVNHKPAAPTMADNESPDLTLVADEPSDPTKVGGESTDGTIVHNKSEVPTILDDRKKIVGVRLHNDMDVDKDETVATTIVDDRLQNDMDVENDVPQSSVQPTSDIPTKSSLCSQKNRSPCAGEAAVAEDQSRKTDGGHSTNDVCTPIKRKPTEGTMPEAETISALSLASKQMGFERSPTLEEARTLSMKDFITKIAQESVDFFERRAAERLGGLRKEAAGLRETLVVSSST
ncbi:hypothetical protein SeMB42_g00527 [Synchytrium endobioticum]|nr:hypothetical protein SeMB42_g00527 [Synchytrium endobioticum]